MGWNPILAVTHKFFDQEIFAQVNSFCYFSWDDEWELESKLLDSNSQNQETPRTRQMNRYFTANLQRCHEDKAQADEDDSILDLETASALCHHRQ